MCFVDLDGLLDVLVKKLVLTQMGKGSRPAQVYLCNFLSLFSVQLQSDAEGVLIKSYHFFLSFLCFLAPFARVVAADDGVDRSMGDRLLLEVKAQHLEQVR